MMLLRFKSMLALILIVIITACGGGSGGDPLDDGGGGTGEGGDTGGPGQTDGEGENLTSGPCNAVHIVNLSRDSRSGLSCTMADTKEGVADCVETSIRNALTDNCEIAFDVFVPGTAAEHGAWKQFNSVFSEDNGRGNISLQYQDDTFTEENNFDAALYDAGVVDGYDSLNDLLYTLKTRFKTTDVRVFGHSKGSHSVALASDNPSWSDMQFYAFAQPGRTAVDISNRSDIKAAKLGVPGKIHKLSNNLLGITWQNDEVKFYQGGKTGLLMPEKWGFPGYIWQDSIGGTLAPFRIDHHNNYGGSYTDGLSQNEWQLGQGSKLLAYPYCATGNKQAMKNDGECVKQKMHTTPYFWGNAGCRDAAFAMMQSGRTGDKKEIGYSGPRGANCAEANDTITVSYGLDYNMNLADQDDCRYTMEFSFQGLFGRKSGDKITVSSTRDTGWKAKTGTIKVPLHMRIRLKASMDQVKRIGDCGHLVAASEGYIRTLHFTFTHPGTGRRVTRTVIGNKEGSDYPLINLDMKNNVAWWNWNDPDDKRDTWDLFYAPRPQGGGGGALMVKGDTDEDRRGYFYKWLHLVD